MANREQQNARPRLVDRLERFLDKRLMRASTSRTIDGLWIGAFDDECEPVLDRMEAALRLIKTYDPRRYQRLIRDIDRIWAHLLEGAVAQFNTSLRACEIDTRFIIDEDTPPEVLAGAIVHEATHARLEHRGIEYHESLRDQIEEICIRQELLFASKLPDGDRPLEFAQARLESLWIGQTRLSGNVALKARLRICNMPGPLNGS